MIEAMACGTPVAAFPCDGPMDVIDQAKTGYMSEDLSDAVDQCLKLDRTRVELGSQRWILEQAWKIFRDNLVEKHPRLLYKYNKSVCANFAHTG
jgi:glycosyltransferase involved in cell wall biosynthesis